MRARNLPADAIRRAQELTFRHTLKVRYGETDQMGIVYHPNYLVWFHEARDALLTAIGVDISRLERDGYRFPMVDVNCQYFRSAHYGDEVHIHVRLLCEAVARFQFQFEVRNARTARVLASGMSLSVITDGRGKVLLRMPESISACLVQAMSRHSCAGFCWKDPK